MTSTPTTEIETQVQALCTAIAESQEVRSARDQAEAFLANQDVVGQYREMMTLGAQLQQRHQSGEQLDDAEIAHFQELKSTTEASDLVQGFQSAQRTLQEVANLVNGYVTKTLETGRVPSPEEMASEGSCGEGCGCHG